jgi:cyclohexanecarboxylate-CoA ligase
MRIAATRPHGVPWPELAPFGMAAPGLLRALARDRGDAPAVVGSGVGLTWGELDRRVSAIACVLTARGVRAGDVVTVQLPNWVETVASFLAVWRLGAVLNPVTPIYRGSELRTIFEMARPTVVLCPEVFGETDYIAMSGQALDEAGIDAVVLPVPRPPASLIDDASLDVAALDDGEGNLASADEVSVLMFTSGTTGRPKGVLHSQRTLMYEAASIVERCNLRDPLVFMPSPLTHITGLLYGVLLPLLTGGCVVLQDRWDARAAVDLIEDHGCTFCVGATPFLVGLTKEYRERGHTSSLEVFVCGGADVAPAVIEEAQEVMGTVAVRAYGLTELPTLSCGIPSDPLAQRSADDGAVIGPSDARIVDVDADAEDGAGELEARGPEMFLGYLDPADNALAFTADGWFRTGDMAVLRGTRVRIAGRRKDIIVRGGENLSPIEVENELRTIPGIADVAVVGVPDRELGERACAMVVTDGNAPSLAQIRDFLVERQLAKQKAPEYLLLCDALPRTASGKVQKFVLRQQAAERIAAGEGERRW